MSGSSWHPAPAGGMAHPLLTPPQAKAAEARELGRRVGVAYGEFRADAEKFLEVWFETPFTYLGQLIDLAGSEVSRCQ
jgi:hypothetical protein